MFIRISRVAGNIIWGGLYGSKSPNRYIGANRGGTGPTATTRVSLIGDATGLSVLPATANSGLFTKHRIIHSKVLQTPQVEGTLASIRVVDLTTTDTVKYFMVVVLLEILLGMGSVFRYLVQAMVLHLVGNR